ncbi:division/cell wall cluster transcriptional repressor MraZ [Gimibacter soli]|uniref:Transcriptional regulator MraZ n=1 Tax=Gimibacter soli TaxID=3024400 RepID=A0AAF0BMF0_9PROT|nr:hypothetical protein [Gimibacter soli]WCL55442.1 hypothetical protein PH603_06680 [Gimibacter soli]
MSVPATFRAAVAGGAFPGIVLYRPFNLACIEGADMAFLERLSDQFYDEFGPFNPDQAALTATILAGAVQLAFDPEGRVMLPGEFKEHAGITDTATFVGIGRKFQIWGPEAFEAYQADQFVKAAEAAPKLRPAKGGQS